MFLVVGLAVFSIALNVKVQDGQLTRICRVWAVTSEQQNWWRAAGTSSAALRLSRAAALPAAHQLNSLQQSREGTEDEASVEHSKLGESGAYTRLQMEQ